MNTSQPTSPTPAAAPAPMPAGSPQPAKSKMWLWILLIVIGLLVIGGIVAAIFFFVLPKAQPANTTPVNTTTNTTTNQPTNDTKRPTTNETPSTGDGLSSADEAYLTDASPVLDAIGTAVESWDAAATAGSESDFEASNAALLEGLDALDQADRDYARLDPTSNTEATHDLLGEALDKAREALELGLEGNTTEDIDKITQSGEAIDELGLILDDLIAEMEEVTGTNSFSTSLIDQLDAVENN